MELHMFLTLPQHGTAICNPRIEALSLLLRLQSPLTYELFSLCIELIHQEDAEPLRGRVLFSFAPSKPEDLCAISSKTSVLS
jgi:hypothetical protein